MLDFGLAKLRERDDSAAITLGGAVVGTPYYMAPEQVRAEPLDARADVYSMGATLYRILTGYPPFQAPSPVAVLSKHLTEEAVPPRTRAPELGLPPEADRIVMRAMAKAPGDRYASSAEVQAELEAALAIIPQVESPTRQAEAGARQSAFDERRPEVTDTPTISISSGSDPGDGGLRLRRRDLEAFEQSLRRRKVMSHLVVPIVLLGLIAATGTLYLRTQTPHAVTSEHEPNNAAGYANPIASDVPVQASIDKMLEGGRGDLDYFQIPRGRGPRAVSARLQGIPDVDLVLELFDAQGRRIAKADARGRGWGEWLQPTALGPAGGYLLVREEWVEGQTPIEDAADRYTLTAHWGPPEPGWESEPNDWKEAATPVTVGRSMRGYLGSADDKDWFALTPSADGRLVGRVRAPAGVDVAVIYGDRGAAGAPTEAPPADAPGDHAGPGRDEEFSLLAHAGQPVLIGVTRKLAAAADSKLEGVPGLEEPYELRSELAPKKAPPSP